MKDSRIEIRIDKQTKEFIENHAEQIHNDVSGLLTMIIFMYLDKEKFQNTKANQVLLEKGIDVNKIIDAECKKKMQQLKRQETRQTRSLINEVYKLHETLFKGVYCNVSFDTLKQHIKDSSELLNLYENNEKEKVYVKHLLTLNEEELKHFIIANMDKRRIYEKIDCTGYNMIEDIKNTAFKVNKNIKNVNLIGEVKRK